ncbi:helix-turn-helix domain-containing protein [Microbacterium oxydans]
MSEGQQVRHAREAAGMSQMDLAKAMRDRGWKWSQATVWSIERGDRPLRWSEGVDMGALTGFGLEDRHGPLVRDALMYRQIVSMVAEAGN